MVERFIFIPETEPRYSSSSVSHNIVELLLFFFPSTGDQIQDLVHARQVLCILSYAPSLFFIFVSEVGSH